MAPTMKDLGIDRLSPADRITLAQEIWESVADDLPAPVPTPEQCQEMARRDAELDADPGIGVSWEEVKANVRGKK